jgi:ribonuclease P protein component
LPIAKIAVIISVFCEPESSLSETHYGNANVPPAQPEAEEQAWLSRADGHEGRSQDSEPSPEARPEAPGRRYRAEAVERCSVAAPSRPESEGRRLPREWRIAHGTEIRDILRRGKRSGTAHLDVFDSPSPVAHPRAGVIVPKHRHAIVARNRVRRRLREIMRLEVLPRLRDCRLPADILVRAKREAYGATYGELRDQLVTWTERRCSRARSLS